MSTDRQLRVAIVGAGPAGIYAADILTKTDLDVSIDLFERLPAPFGLVRYGVAPDHPRIKQIITALHKVLDRGDIRLLSNVDYGIDVKLDELREFYDAVIFSTGAIADASLDVPGVELDGSYGAADFVSWYDGHPYVPTTWPLEAESVAVVGAGNVALDVARILAKHADDLLVTEIPKNVYEGLKASPVKDVHVFARRGPAQAKFSPLELRELGHVPDVDVIVYPEDFEFDDGSLAAIGSSNQTKQVVKTLTDWTLNDPSTFTASRRLHLHFLHAPAEILDTDGDGKVDALRTERTQLNGDGTVTRTGEYQEWPVQAVYRAVGYFGSPLPELPFDDHKGVIPNVEGRVIDIDGRPVDGVYCTGWIKRGPVGLIGHTKSDASETVRNLVEDSQRPDFASATQPAPAAVTDFLRERGVQVVEWSGWQLLDAHERALGEAEGRERVKVVPREEMIDIALGARRD
ncbi:FAD-dependent oxidoreductase [Sanguibacter suaedae]|uniref:ferredoxin--NADP(+) reductase n=1 Tax=Sanguibacter suaedae TaxID=2795737 RepID=A0A934M8V6_9MICO|nr:FAD-dependent oxidoreductase [Sanguibacter suaedae]MBI9113983.1 FAD-dependent oxidoreductase [Sanguibacter suaedae]